MDNRYPIGKFQLPEKINKDDIRMWVNEIEEAPTKLNEAVKGLTKGKLESPYRHGGWKLYQVIHHLADAHINGYIRIKVGLTEKQPTIKTYNQESWAVLKDNKLPIDVSLNLFSLIHKRLTFLLKSLNEEELKRTVFHPESGLLTIEQLIATYAWHGKHHIAHITSLRKQKGW